MVKLADPQWRAPLLELLYTGRLPKKASTAALSETVVSLQWAIQEKEGIVLLEEKRPTMEKLLNKSWPDWRLYGDGCNGEFTNVRLRSLMRGKSGHLTLDSVITGGQIYNQKTISALSGLHSKAGRMIDNVQVVSDYAARLRPNKGLMLINQEGRILSTDILSMFMHEMLLCERNIRIGLRVGGAMPTAILVVENAAAYMDVDVDDDVAVIYGAGNAFNGALGAIGIFPQHIPVVWFGDLDPEGVQIRQSFLKLCRNPALAAIPPFWTEYVDGYGRPARKGWKKLNLANEPELLHTLKEKDLWLEQEPVAVDPRFRLWFGNTFKDGKN